MDRISGYAGVIVCTRQLEQAGALTAAEEEHARAQAEAAAAQTAAAVRAAEASRATAEARAAQLQAQVGQLEGEIAQLRTRSPAAGARWSPQGSGMALWPVMGPRKPLGQRWMS